MHWLYLTIAVVCEVFGTTALRASMGFTRLVPSIVVVVGYAGAFYFLSLTLTAIPLGLAYAVWSGIGVILISLSGWYLYGQQLDLAALLGIGLITAGVVVIKVFSRSLMV